MGISTPIALLASGGLSAASSLASGAIGSSAASSAAQQQQQAADQASANQLAEFAQIKSSLAPFLSAGQSAQGALSTLTGTGAGGNPLTAPLTAPFAPTMASLAATPGYQFILQQGEQATQNGYAAQGLGQSGAALKGAANYAEALAGTTYQNQFENYLQQNSQIANILGGQVASGENAAAMTGNAGTTNVSAANALLTGGAAAGAAGTIGSANSVNSAISGISGAGANTGLLLSLANGGLFGSSSAGTSTPTGAAALNALNIPQVSY